MKEDEKRRWLPAEAYRFLVLAALAHRAGAAASKRDLAWETRANHYMITRVLQDLRAAGHVELEGDGVEGYRIRLTAGGHAFYERHREYARSTFGSGLEAHFRYGRRPSWAATLAGSA